MSNVSITIDLKDHNYQKIRSMISDENLHTSVGDIIWSQNKLLSDMNNVLDYLNRRMQIVSTPDDSVKIHFLETSPYSKVPKVPDYYRTVRDILVQTLLSLFDAMSEMYSELLRLQVNSAAKQDKE